MGYLRKRGEFGTAFAIEKGEPHLELAAAKLAADDFRGPRIP
jgi:hypothetical protein